MVKVCEGHKKELEDGCTYQIVKSGFSTSEKIGISLGETGIYLRDSECVVCQKLKKTHELVALIGREMESLGLIDSFCEEDRKAIYTILYHMIDFKVKEHW